MRCLLCVCVAIILLLGHPARAAIVSADYDLLDMSINYFFFPPTYSKVAVFTVTADAPLYTRAGQCQRNNLCNQTNFGRCCQPSDCDPVTFQPLVTGCVCPSRAGHICLDPSTPYIVDILDAAPSSQQVFFEIPLLRECHNTIIDLGNIWGEWDLTLGLLTQSAQELSDIPFYVSTSLGNDQIVLCADRTDGVVGLYSTLSNTHNNFVSNLAPDGVARIYGMAVGTGYLRLAVSEVNDSNSLVQHASQQAATTFYTLGQLNLTCNGNPVLFGKSPTPFLPIYLPPTAEPLYDWQLERALLRRGDSRRYNPNQLSFVAAVGSDELYNANINLGDLSSCVLDLSQYYTQDGTPITDVPVTFTARTTSTCNYTHLQELNNVATFEAAALIANLTNSAIQTAVAVYSEAGAAAAYEWASCRRHADLLLLQNSYVVENDKICYAIPGTTEYLNDPCCNVDLSWYQCCSPRTTEGVVLAANSLAVQRTCTVPSCSEQVAAAYAAISKRALNGQCAAEALQNRVSTLDPLGNGIGTQFGVCADVLQSGGDLELISCMDNALDPQYKAEFFTLWGISGTDWAAGALQVYYNVTGCLQPGAPAFDTIRRTSMRNEELDKNQTACEITPDCNWQAGLDNTTCVASYRGQFMCADCDSDGFCTDYTVVEVCYNPFTSSTSAPKATFCAAANGVTDTELGCIYPLRNTRDACLPPTVCSPLPFMTTCLPTCYFPSIPEVECNCSLAVSDPASAICDTLFWDADVGVCKSSLTLLEDCSAVSGQFFEGAVWQEGQFDTQAKCNVGLCPDSPGLNQTECAAVPPAAGSCSNNCLGCNQTECETKPGCNDGVLAFNAPNPGTCITDFIGYGSNFGFCIAGALASTNLGCIWNDQFTPDFPSDFVCSVFPGVIVAPATNQTQCESYGRCIESNFDTVHTPKGPAECAACGGTYERAFTWGNGVWTPGAPAQPWRPLAWRQRFYMPRYRWVVSGLFNRSGLAEDFYSIQARQQARAGNQTALCHNAELYQSLVSLGCDCSPGSSVPCYTEAQLQLIALSRACSSVPSTIVLGTTGGSLTINGGNFSVPCIDIVVEQIQQASFKVGVTAYASLFLQTISAGSFAVLKNDDKVAVGSLIGDGVRISQGSGSMQGTFNLCLLVDPSTPMSSRFTVYDFAVMYENCNFTSELTLGSANDLSAESIKPLDIPATRNGSFLCGDIPTSAGSNFFPVRRASEWRSFTFRESLRRSMYAVIVFFAAVSLFTVIRLVSVVIFWVSQAERTTSNLVQLAIVFSIAFGASTIRWVYFLLTVLGKLISTSRVGQLLLSELPFYLFLTIFTVLIAWWAEIYHSTPGARSNKRRKRIVRAIGIIVNIIIYVFLIGVVIAFAVGKARSPGLCGDKISSSDELDTLGKVYKTFVAVIGILLAIGFILYGSFIVVPVFLSKGGGPVLGFMQFSMLAILCAVGLALQSALLIYTTYAGKVNTVFALCVLIVVEVIPALALIFVLRLPGSSNVFTSIFWCFGDVRGKSTTASGTGSRSSDGAAKNINDSSVYTDDQL